MLLCVAVLQCCSVAVLQCCNLYIEVVILFYLVITIVMVLSTLLSLLYLHSSLLLTLVGNTLVLYSTTRYSAIQLDYMAVWLIQNLAVVMPYLTTLV